MLFSQAHKSHLAVFLSNCSFMWCSLCDGIGAKPEMCSSMCLNLNFCLSSLDGVNSCGSFSFRDVMIYTSWREVPSFQCHFLGSFSCGIFLSFHFSFFSKNLKCFTVNIKKPLVSLASNITIELVFTSLSGTIQRHCQKLSTIITNMGMEDIYKHRSVTPFSNKSL